MSKFKRIRDVIFGVFMILLALFMILLPENSLGIVVLILTVSMFAYGFRLLWFYFTMSRHMVGGKATLYRAIIVLDLALFLVSAAALSRIIVLIYLIFIFIFTGIIDILRSFEAKINGAANWRFKMTTGVITVLLAIGLIVAGLFFQREDILVYGYCISLIYSAVTRIANAFRKTAIVYIQ